MKIQVLSAMMICLALLSATASADETCSSEQAKAVALNLIQNPFDPEHSVKSITDIEGALSATLEGDDNDGWGHIVNYDVLFSAIQESQNGSKLRIAGSITITRDCKIKTYQISALNRSFFLGGQ